MINDTFPSVILQPMDEFNQKLLDCVHPSDWVNPTGVDEYDIIVIGAGVAGLVISAGIAGLGIGLKVALVEKYLMGGDCLNFGCVPSKAIIRSTKLIGEIKRGEELGITLKDNPNINFKKVMERMRKLRAGISHNDSVQRFQGLGVDVFLGEARFIKEKVIEVNGQLLNYKKAVIATGGRAFIPDIDGLKEGEYYTNESIFSLTDCPARLAIIGGGAIGCELAQTFQRLGSQVTLFHRHSQLLNKEDRTVGDLLQTAFTQEGIKLFLESNIEKVERGNEGKRIVYCSQGKLESVEVDAILVAVGRTPNVESLNLESVGVEYDKKGLKVNDYLQTTNASIYGAGDVCLPWKFTHVADASARIIIKNALFSPFGLGKAKISDLIIPWVTYTDPEIAHVGLNENDAKVKGIEIETVQVMMGTVDRAITDNQTQGFIKVYHKKGSDQILGATLVGSHAGEMISQITTAIVHKIGLSGLSTVIHPYPTQAEVIKKAADGYRRKLLTPTSQKFLKLLAKLSH